MKFFSIYLSLLSSLCFLKKCFVNFFFIFSVFIFPLTLSIQRRTKISAHHLENIFFLVGKSFSFWNFLLYFPFSWKFLWWKEFVFLSINWSASLHILRGCPFAFRLGQGWVLCFAIFDEFVIIHHHDEGWYLDWMSEYFVQMF